MTLTTQPSENDSSQGDLRIVGKPLPRVDAVGKLTGATAYADDIELPGTLFVKILRSPHPHARVLSVDTSSASSMTGVAAVITGHDLPTKYGIMPTTEDELALEYEKVRFVGDPVAAVAAVDEETALAACRAIRVEYQPLETIESIEQALLLPADEPIHDYAGPANIHRLAAPEFGDRRRGLRQGRPHPRGCLLLRGQHPPRDGTALVDGDLCR